MSYTLHYFGGNGRATIPRAILTYAKAKWTDNRVEQGDWLKLKRSGLCEFEQMPILVIDGKKKLSQSVAISLYLLKTFNLYGKNIDEQYQIDSLLCTFDDLLEPLADFVMCFNQMKKEEFKKVFIEKYKLYLKKYEERYVSLGKGKYFLGDHFSGADIFVGCALPLFSHAIGWSIVKDNAPVLGELVKRLKEGELKEFHEKVFNKDSPF